MGALDLGAGRERRHGAKGRLRKRRLGIRVDMTPMVDVAFLLLIFFMVTTVFRTPQALDINLPPKNKVRPVPQKDILYLRVVGDRIFWNMGNDTGRPASVDLAQLPAVIRSHHEVDAQLVVLIKVDREAHFHYMVDIIDVLDVARVTRFSMVPLTDEERREVGSM